MIYILHGDNQVASRNRLQQLKADFEKKGWQTIFFDGKTTTFEQINLVATTGSLLGEGNLVIVENFFSGRKNTETRDIDGNIIFWGPKELSKTLINSFPESWKIEAFSIPRFVFKFLDSIIPRKPMTSLKILHQIYEQGEPAEAILPLLSWHTRYLIWSKEDSKTLIAPPWKRGKLLRQAAKFKSEKLFLLHSKLLDLDRGLKTGSNPIPVSNSLDLLIIDL